MSTYKELRGLRVKYVPTDTTSPSTAASGDVWYNTAEGKLKTYVGRAAFSASGSLGTGRNAFHQGAAGTTTAGLVFGGWSDADEDATEEYNGTGWSTGGNLNTARRSLGGAGTQTSGLAFGGTGPAKDDEAETYDGSSWTEVGDLNTARRDLGGAGTQTAAIAFGGESQPGSRVAVAESFDGSSWTEGPD